MFSSLLRKRTDLKNLIPKLTSPIGTKLKEGHFENHDLELPLAVQAQNQNGCLRLLILSSISLQERVKEDTASRIERFSIITGGDCIAIAFLLSTVDGEENSPSGMHALGSLQVLIHAHPTLLPLPLLPVPSPAHLLPILNTYVAAVSSPPTPLVISNPVRLLPYITSTAPSRLLPEHTTYVLSDVCHSLSEVAAMTQTEEGRKVIRDYVGESATKSIEEFWGEEWVYE